MYGGALVTGLRFEECSMYRDLADEQPTSRANRHEMQSHVSLLTAERSNS